MLQSGTKETDLVLDRGRCPYEVVESAIDLSGQFLCSANARIRAIFATFLTDDDRRMSGTEVKRRIFSKSSVGSLSIEDWGLRPQGRHGLVKWCCWVADVAATARIRTTVGVIFGIWIWGHAALWHHTKPGRCHSSKLVLLSYNDHQKFHNYIVPTDGFSPSWNSYHTTLGSDSGQI